MTHPPSSKPPVPDQAFEFELTDFASARDALDGVSLQVAAEASRPTGPVDWVARRRALVPTDRALAGATIDWLLSLPAPLQPHGLVDQVPRLANQIAAAWPDRSRCLHALKALLTDDRGGRRGLPYALRLEIEALLQHLATLPA